MNSISSEQHNIFSLDKDSYKNKENLAPFAVTSELPVKVSYLPQFSRI